jgi:exodeoxyribonuclease III
MDKFLVKRPRGAVADAGGNTKRPRAQWGTRDPETFVAWNCNGLTVRLESAQDEHRIRQFVAEQSPDILCLSEVRAAAYCSTPGSRRGDGAPRVRSKAGEADRRQLADKRKLETLFHAAALTNYRPYLSLADSKYAGSAVLVNRSVVKKPIAVRYSLDLDAPADRHNDDGRVILVEWDTLAVLHTYSPNNGWKADSFARREAWDAEVKKVLAHYRALGKDVLWLGDLNIAPLDADLSHPVFYKTARGGVGVKKPPAEYVGQPGCTPGERKSFADILEAGGLVDLYREVHPAVTGVEVSEPVYSWRGSTPGKYSSRGMRIDHFIGPKSLVERVESVVVCGRGVDREGFLGSDHCPIALKLRPSSA